jgi:hypothetical protein
LRNDLLESELDGKRQGLSEKLLFSVLAPGVVYSERIDSAGVLGTIAVVLGSVLVSLPLNISPQRLDDI